MKLLKGGEPKSKGPQSSQMMSAGAQGCQVQLEDQKNITYNQSLCISNSLLLHALTSCNSESLITAIIPNQYANEAEA